MCSVCLSVYICLSLCLFNLFFFPLILIKDKFAHILRAPMPGVVRKLSCAVGDAVEEGAAVVTLEAMKMQNPLFAPVTGIVSALSKK